MLLTLHVGEADRDSRLDVFLTRQQEFGSAGLPRISRTHLQRLIKEGCVRLSGKVICKPNHRLSGGEQITIAIPEPEPLDVQPEPIPLKIIYQDAHLAVIDKPAGMVVHPSGRKTTGTLVNALLYHLSDLSGIGGKLRPGIVHRLDKGTSGLMLIAKSDLAHSRLTEAFRQRLVHKTYLALVLGCFKEKQGVIDYPLARHRTQRHKIAAVMSQAAEASRGRCRKVRPAVTHYEVSRDWENVSLVTVRPQTGRTHQIRVHLAQLGHPVLGDATYGYHWHKDQHLPKRLIDGLRGPALHAWTLDLDHPVTGESFHFEAALPERLQNFIDWLDHSK